MKAGTGPDARGGLFPIRQDYYTPHAKPVAAHPSRIPWSLAEEAHGVYLRQYGGSGTLTRMMERGGFTGGEMDLFMPDWRERCSEIAALEAPSLSVREAALLAAARLADQDLCAYGLHMDEDDCPQCRVKVALRAALVAYPESPSE